MRLRSARAAIVGIVAGLATGAGPRAASQTPFDEDLLKAFSYRKAETSAKPTIAISDSKGKEVAKLTGAGKTGINSVRWTTRDRGDEAGRGRGGRGGAGRAGEGGGGRQAGPGVNVLDQWAPLGEYTVTLDVGGKKHTRKAQITKMQGWSIGATPQIIKSTVGRGSS